MVSNRLEEITLRFNQNLVLYGIEENHQKYWGRNDKRSKSSVFEKHENVVKLQQCRLKLKLCSWSGENHSGTLVFTGRSIASRAHFHRTESRNSVLFLL